MPPEILIMPAGNGGNKARVQDKRRESSFHPRQSQRIRRIEQPVTA